jgi:hypothetical protein
MSEGGFKQRDVEVARPPAPLLSKLFDDVHVPAAQPVLEPAPEPAQDVVPPDPTALLACMRNDVFHTDDATAAAAERLKANGINQTAINAFKERAAAASTPEQVQMLERELHP